jgi:hypothetical protein
MSDVCLKSTNRLPKQLRIVPLQSKLWQRREMREEMLRLSKKSTTTKSEKSWHRNDRDVRRGLLCKGPEIMALIWPTFLLKISICSDWMSRTILNGACKHTRLVPRLGLLPEAKKCIREMNPERRPKSASRFPHSFPSISAAAVVAL